MEKVCCRPVLELVCMHRQWLSSAKWQWQQVVPFSALPFKYSCSPISDADLACARRNSRRVSKKKQLQGRVLPTAKYYVKKSGDNKMNHIFVINDSDHVRLSISQNLGNLRANHPGRIITSPIEAGSRAEVDIFCTLLLATAKTRIMSPILRVSPPSLKLQTQPLRENNTLKTSIQTKVNAVVKLGLLRKASERQNSFAAIATSLSSFAPHGLRSELFRNRVLPPFSSSHRKLFISHTSNDPAWRDSMCISMDSEDREGRQNVDDVLFDMFKDEATEKVHMGRFIAALTETGLRRTDPRLKEFRDNLAAVHNLRADHDESSITALDLTRDLFKRVLRDNVVLISRALRHHFVIPQWADFCSHIEDFYWAGKTLKGGHVASYIPQLARFNPDYWGVSVCSIDGQRYSIGDTNVSFTTQSCSKPITYAIALNELGADTVHRYVGTEPSGRMFNAIVLDYNNKPHNPLVNAGAIVVSALLHQLVRPELASSEKFDFVQQYFSRLAGGEMVGFSNGTFLSERENADRNYALAYYMRENKCFPEKTDLTSSLDLYFQSCSMEVTTESMSVMAATLANGGICPITGDQVLQPAAVRDVLSLMHSCGMYDYSGQFAFKVGLPAKSGVCGAVMLVIPNVVGICTWSPPLDTLGNSVRGIKFAEKLVEMFNFHRYDNLRFAANKKDPRREKYETRGQKVVSLLFSASTGDVTAMRRYALSGLNMSECDYDGRTALHLAASEGHLDVAKFLLEKCRVNVTPLDRWKRTPADDAQEFGFTEVEQYLRQYAAEHPDQCGTDDMVKSPPPTIPEIPDDKLPSPDSTK